MVTDPTRRSALAAMMVAPLAALPLVATVPIAAITASHSSLEADFSEWKATKLELEAWGADDGDDHLWDRLRAAERRIAAQAHSSVRAVEMSLWIGLTDVMVMQVEHDAIMREDIAYLRACSKEADPAETILLNMVASIRQSAREGR